MGLVKSTTHRPMSKQMPMLRSTRHSTSVPSTIPRVSGRSGQRVCGSIEECCAVQPFWVSCCREIRCTWDGCSPVVGVPVALKTVRESVRRTCPPHPAQPQEAQRPTSSFAVLFFSFKATSKVLWEIFFISRTIAPSFLLFSIHSSKRSASSGLSNLDTVLFASLLVQWA